MSKSELVGRLEWMLQDVADMHAIVKQLQQQMTPPPIPVKPRRKRLAKILTFRPVRHKYF